MASADCRMSRGDKPNKRKFKSYPIGYFHIDIAEVRTAEGRLYLFVAIDRTSKFAFVHTVLTDNGLHFTDPTGNSWTPKDIEQMPAEGERFRVHAFKYACAPADIDHRPRLTKPKRLWTNGQVKPMNRVLGPDPKIKEATVNRFYYETHDQLRNHLADFVSAYNFAKRLGKLKGLTPYEYICNI